MSIYLKCAQIQGDATIKGCEGSVSLIKCAFTGVYKPVEDIILGYDSFEITYTPRNADNSMQSPVRTGFDVSKGIPV